MNAIESNRSTILQMLDDVEEKGFLAQVDYFADESTNHGFPANRDIIRGVLQDILTTFPDAKFETACVVAEGDWVVVRCYLSGTHLGTGQHPFVHEGLLTGVEPTGKSFRVQHIHMFRLNEGRIVEHWASRDDVAMVRQLGVTSALATTGE